MVPLPRGGQSLTTYRLFPLTTGTASPCRAHGVQWTTSVQKPLMAPSGPLTLTSKTSFLRSNIHDQTLCKGMSGSSVSTLSPEICSVRYFSRSQWQLPGHWHLCPNWDKLANSRWKAPSATAAEQLLQHRGCSVTPSPVFQRCGGQFTVPHFFMGTRQRPLCGCHPASLQPRASSHRPSLHGRTLSQLQLSHSAMARRTMPNDIEH